MLDTAAQIRQALGDLGAGDAKQHPHETGRVGDEQACGSQQERETEEPEAKREVISYPDGSLHIFTVGAYYNDKLVYTPDGWRIRERYEEQAYMEGSLPEALEIPS